MGCTENQNVFEERKLEPQGYTVRPIFQVGCDSTNRRSKLTKYFGRVCRFQNLEKNNKHSPPNCTQPPPLNAKASTSICKRRGTPHHTQHQSRILENKQLHTPWISRHRTHTLLSSKRMCRYMTRQCVWGRTSALTKRTQMLEWVAWHSLRCRRHSSRWLHCLKPVAHNRQNKQTLWLSTHYMAGTSCNGD